jgi:hypothetical protein
LEENMRVLNTFIENEKMALVKGDGGKYYVEMYDNMDLVDTKVFDEHTLRIVEKYAKEWTNNEREIN